MTKVILMLRNNMTIKAVTFDLDDTLWPLYDVIMNSHKLSNDWLINKHPQMKEILFSTKEREMWQRLIKAEPSLANRLSELRKKVIETLLVENGVEISLTQEEETQRDAEEKAWLAKNPIISLTDAEIQAEVVRLKEEYENNKYQRDRKADYPDIGDQLDDLYHAGVFSDEMVAKLKAVKK